MRAIVAVAALATAMAAQAATAQQAAKKQAPAKSGAASYAQRFATVCASCHGANGRSDLQGTPVLAGQHPFYATTQLFLFREGRRENEAMSAVAKSLTDEDLRGFADHIGTLPPVAPPAPAQAADTARMRRGQSLATQYKCVFCHGQDLSGGQQVPRIAGQKEEYLQLSLKGYKAGTRKGYTPAMSEALSQVPVEDLDVLAYYVSRVPVTGAK